MIIHLNGTNFANKGAELMMCAVIDQVHQWSGTHQIAAKIGKGSFQERNKVGLYHLVDLSPQIPFGHFFNEVTNYTPQFVKKISHIVGNKDVQVVLDASGFAYSDQQEVGKIENIFRKHNFWKNRGVKYVFLPQAFGPFDDPRLRQLFSEVVSFAEVVFARDKQSYQYLLDLRADQANIRMAPDFTNLLEVKPIPFVYSGKKSVCIIPNFRMVDKTDKDTSEAYWRFLVKSIDFLLSHNGLQPFWLLHSSGADKDHELAVSINAETQQSIPIVAESSPLAIKSIVGQSYAVISARYHGLISALCQGIPTLTTSWSHKYEYLLDDYKSSDYLVDLSQEKTWQDQLLMLIDSDVNAQHRESLLISAQHQRALSHEMWAQVRQILGQRKLV